MSPPSRGLRGPPGLGSPRVTVGVEAAAADLVLRDPRSALQPAALGTVARSGPGRSGPNGLYTGRWAGPTHARRCRSLSAPSGFAGTRDDGYEARARGRPLRGPGGGGPLL